MYEFSNQIFGGGGGYSPSLSYDPSSAFNVEPSMDYSFEPDYSSFNPNSFMDYSFEPDYSFDPFMDYSFEQDYSFDPFMDDSYGGIDPVALAGLGLGGGFVSSQVGGTPATSQVLSPFAQRVAAQDASRMAARNLPQLIGTPQTYQGVPTGPSTPPQFTGTAPARPIPGTQLAPPNQPPAVSSPGGALANMKYAQRVGPPATMGAGAAAAATGLLGRLNPYLGAATGGYLGGKVIDAFGGDALRAVGLTDRGGNISDILGSTVGEALYGNGNLPAFSEEELAQIQQGSMASDYNLPQMSRLGDEPLSFTQPTGPSSTATRAAQIAASLPDDSGLMGFPGIQGTGIPTTTINVDGGSATVPEALAYQTFRGVGSAPMGIEETRARLGGRTLNQYLNAPDGTPGVYGLRTDPQGRMISTREGEQATGGLSDYEKASAERYARMDERKRRPGESRTQRDTRLAQGETERTLYGGYTEAQLRDLFGPQNLRAAKAKLSAGVDPITNKRLSDERRDAYDDALKTQILEERLINYRQEDPDKYEKARVLIEKMIQSRQIAPQDGKQYMLRALNLDKKSFDEDSESALMKMIREAGEGSEGNSGGSEGRSDIPQEAIDALRSNPSRASEFDKYFGQGSSAQFL